MPARTTTLYIEEADEDLLEEEEGEEEEEEEGGTEEVIDELVSGEGEVKMATATTESGVAKEGEAAKTEQGKLKDTTVVKQAKR